MFPIETLQCVSLTHIDSMAIATELDVKLKAMKHRRAWS
jgi:hypothetical protein